MSKRKSFPVTEEEYKYLQRMKNITKEDKQNNRLETIKINEMKIKHQQRVIDFKKGQIENKTSLEKEEAYLDNIKPFYMLQNEIEILENQNQQLEEINKSIQEEYDKEEKG